MKKLFSAINAASICLAPWTVAVAMTTGSLLGMPVEGIAQQQTPTYSAEQQAALKEAQELTQQVVKLSQQGQYSTAIPLAERALAIHEKVLSKEHPLVANSLNNLALLYLEQGKYEQAEPLYLRAVAIYEKVGGKEQITVATSLINLAELYRTQAKYQQAEPLYLRALTIYEKLLGKEHPNFATSLNNLAELYNAQGKYQQAEPLYLRSLAIREKLYDKEHPYVAESLNNLAQLYKAQGKYQQAEPLLLRAVAIFEKVLGEKHPNFATSLNNLAELYNAQGKYQQAEPLYLRSLAIREKVYGKEHPSVADSLGNLAAMYKTQGNYQQAEPLFIRALAIYEKMLGEKHPDVALGLNNLAALYDSEGKYQQAEPLYLRSLAIWEEILGKEHPNVAISLNNLAGLYYLQGKYQQAEPLYLRALAIRETAGSKENPDVALSLNNLANLYREEKKYQQAEPLYLHALAIREKVLGKKHPTVAQSLNGLAIMYQAQGDITHANDFFRRGLEVETQNLNLIFAVGAEQRKQSYVKTFFRTTNIIISRSLQTANNNPSSASLALTTVLRRKGLVLDAVADSIQILRSKLDKNPETQKLFAQWLQVQQQLSALVFAQPAQQTRNPKAELEQLEAEREKLESAISAKSAEFRQQTQPVELAAIQAKIPKDAALVEIVQYKPFNNKAKTDAEKFGKPRYAAAVLRSSGEPKWVDLGEAAEIDKLAIDFRDALSTGKPFKKLARTLDEKLIAPIRPLLGNASHILISPDGQLTLIPFEALKDEQGKFLIQRYSFSYLTTGRDLLRFQSNVSNASAPVVLADIDYDNQKQTVASAKSPSVRGVQNRRSGDLANLEFPSLTATKNEAVAIKKVFPNAKILSGKDATETAVKQLHSPSILHLATHGFFITDAEQDLNASPEFELTPRPKKIIQVENPLLRSGLALAGANKRNQVKNGNDDGVLTALEVAGLDFRSNQLVVLSACDTGKGDVKVGDGVYGLRRALVIAGSQSQVLSLWLVSDEATKELMVKYYRNLKAGKGRHEALRSAQLELLNGKYESPYFWAAFVPSGNWTPLGNK